MLDVLGERPRRDPEGTSAAAVVGGGAFYDVHLLGVEGVARDGAFVADAVDEDTVGAVEAAKIEGVAAGAGGATAFAGREGDAGGVAEDVTEAGGALL